MTEAQSGPAELAQHALALVGAPFRLHGRDPATGLDCIGVLVAACAAIGRPVRVPNGYRIRSTRLPDDLRALAETAGFADAHGAPAPGDVLMVQAGPCQFHLVIAVPALRFVHADAGLGRVVVMPGPLPWPVIHHWRPGAPNRG